MSNQVMTQEEAVYQAVINVCGEQEEAYAPSKEERAQITNILVEGFSSGRIAFKDTESNRAKLASDKALRSYVSGLQSNWLRKDPRLNGNVKYTPKNPGSRTGSTDPQVKAMRTLLATRTDLSAEDKAEIQAAIAKRQGEIKPAVKAELSAEQVALLESMGLGNFVK